MKKTTKSKAFKVPDSTLNLLFADSKCATNNKQKRYLADQILFNFINISSRLLYRGSDDGWNNNDFHSKCDNYSSPTITLFKLKDGDCMGGLTKAHWSSHKAFNSNTDYCSILFNLSSFNKFPSKEG